MFRKALLTGLTVLGLALPLSLTATADAHPPIEHRHCSFEVMYGRHHHLRCYGTFHSRAEAERVAHRLRCEGYEVRVEERG